jgi:TPR repeat protein
MHRTLSMVAIAASLVAAPVAKMRKLIAAIAVGLFLFASLPVSAQTLQDGVTAYERGDYENALAIFTSLSEEGDATAQTKLGWMYAYGRVIPLDLAEALRWFRLAADQGDASAYSSLGRMHQGGWGVPQDYAEALRLFRLAVEQGDAVGQTELGFMYAQGWGVNQDYTEAARLFRLASDQGNTIAQHNLRGGSAKLNKSISGVSA